jgi:putative flippase GtrA
MALLDILKRLGAIRPSPEELLKFSVTGAVGFTVDYAVLEFLVRVLGIGAFLARPISVGVAIFATWALNRNWTFKSIGGSSIASTLPKYFLVQSLGGLINYMAFSLALLLMPVLQHYLIIPVGFGSAIALGFNYVFCRRVFDSAYKHALSE